MVDTNDRSACSSQPQAKLEAAYDCELPDGIKEYEHQITTENPFLFFFRWIAAGAPRTQVDTPTTASHAPPKVTKVALEGAEYVIEDVQFHGALTLQVAFV